MDLRISKSKTKTMSNTKILTKRRQIGQLRTISNPKKRNSIQSTSMQINQRKLSNKIPVLRNGIKNGQHKYSKRDNSMNLSGNKNVFNISKRKKSNKKSICKIVIIWGFHQNRSAQGNSISGPNYSGSLTNHKDSHSYMRHNHQFVKRKQGNSNSREKPKKKHFSSKFIQNFTTRIKKDQKSLNGKINKIDRIK